MECLLSGTISGPCWDHFWPSFTYRPARVLKLSTLYLHGLRHIYLEFLFLGTMSGPCWDHVLPSFTSRPARSLKFPRLSQHGLRPMSTECVLIRTISGPCLDHVGTMLGLALLPDQLEHCNFQGCIKRV